MTSTTRIFCCALLNCFNLCVVHHCFYLWPSSAALCASNKLYFLLASFIHSVVCNVHQSENMARSYQHRWKFQVSTWLIKHFLVHVSLLIFQSSGFSSFEPFLKCSYCDVTSCLCAEGVVIVISSVFTDLRLTCVCCVVTLAALTSVLCCPASRSTSSASSSPGSASRPAGSLRLRSRSSGRSGGPRTSLVSTVRGKGPLSTVALK